MQRRRSPVSEEADSFIPMVEIFGGTFAALLILLIFLNFYGKDVGERLRTLKLPPKAADYRLPWPGGTTGYLVLVLPDRLKVVETRAVVYHGHYCDPTSSFVAYARDRYLSKREHIVFVIFEGGISSFVEARSCLLKLFAGSETIVSWIVADKEVLREVGEDRFPAYIDTLLERGQ